MRRRPDAGQPVRPLRGCGTRSPQPFTARYPETAERPTRRQRLGLRHGQLYPGGQVKQRAERPIGFSLLDDLLGKLVAARASPAARLALASKLVPPSDGQGFRATADLIGAVLRRVAALQAGHLPGVELVPGETDLLAALAAGRGLDHWVAMWDKLTALAGRVDAVNLDPLQTLLQIVQAVCGADPEAELSIA